MGFDSSEKGFNPVKVLPYGKKIKYVRTLFFELFRIKLKISVSSLIWYEKSKKKKHVREYFIFLLKNYTFFSRDVIIFTEKKGYFLTGEVGLTPLK